MEEIKYQESLENGLEKDAINENGTGLSIHGEHVQGDFITRSLGTVVSTECLYAAD